MILRISIEINLLLFEISFNRKKSLLGIVLGFQLQAVRWQSGGSEAATAWSCCPLVNHSQPGLTFFNHLRFKQCFFFNGIFVVVAVVCLLAAWDGRGRWTQKKEH